MLKLRQYSKSTSNLLEESDAESKLEFERKKEQQRLKEKLQNIKIDQLCDDYSKEGLFLSDLNYTRYKSLFHSNVTLIPVLPKIDPNVLQEEAPQKQFNQLIIPKKKALFLNQQEIKHIKSQVLDKLENDLYEYQPKLFKKKKKQLPPRSRLSSLNSNMTLNSSQMSNIDYDVLLALNHNKGVLMQSRKQEYQNVNKQLNYLTSNQDFIPNKKIAKVRSFPMKSCEEVAAIEERQTILMQQLNDETIPTQHAYWVTIEINSWRPRMREGFSFNKIGRKCIIYGGINSQKMNDVVEYDFQNGRWKECQTYGEKPNFGRNNHTGNNYKKFIYMFGGEKQYDENSKTRECVNDFRILNCESMDWKIVKTNGDSIEGRRGHASFMLGKKLIIFGGINTKGYYLNSFYHLDITNNKLTSDLPLQSNSFEDGIAFHTLTGVYFRNNGTLYKQNEEDEDNKIKYEGLYCYGGESNTGKYYDTLYILQTDSRPLQWIKPECKGIMPSARIRHSASYLDSLNMYIIYGGFSQNGDFLGDIHILRTDKLCWCKAVTNKSINRVGHQVVVEDKRMYVFGGYNENGFLPGELDSLELDNRMAQKLNSMTLTEKPHDFLDHRQQKASQDSIQLKKVQDQVRILNYNNLNSFLPMPQRVVRVETRRLTQIQLEQMEKIKEETSRYVEIEQLKQKKIKKFQNKL